MCALCKLATARNGAPLERNDATTIIEVAVAKFSSVVLNAVKAVGADPEKFVGHLSPADMAGLLNETTESFMLARMLYEGRVDVRLTTVDDGADHITIDFTVRPTGRAGMVS